MSLILENRGRPYEFKENESSQGSLLWGDFKDFNTTSFVSTSTNPRIICEAFKAHAEKSLYRIPPYVLSDRVIISTTMNLDEFRVNQFLSRGNKSEIYSAKISFCPSVVIKKATSEALAEKEILNEIQLLTKMKHQNIITIRGARVANPEPFMVLEELLGGTLSDLLQRRGGRTLPCGRAMDIACQLISALQYIHEDLSPYAMIIHRDLHPENVGFTTRFQLKLFDFGIATVIKKRLFRMKTYQMTNIDDGNNLYMAPEVVNNQPYNEKVDIFCFGVILRLLLTGAADAPQVPEEEDPTIGDGPSDNSNSSTGSRPVPTTTPMQLLIDQCTAADYYLRPSSTVILRHLRDELEALAQSFSLCGMIARWGRRKGRAISKRISRYLHVVVPEN